MSDYISERFDEMSKALHLDCKVRGLATYEDFREVAIERVIKPQNVVSLDLQDVKAICQSGDVFDALSFDITKDKADCFQSAIRQLQQAHPRMALSALLCNLPMRDRVEVHTWAASLQDVFEEMESRDIERKFGLFYSNETPPEGVIIAAFTSQNAEKSSKRGQ